MLFKAIKIVLEGKVKNIAYVNIEQIILKQTEIWDEMFNYEDNIGLLVLKTIASKMTTICEGIFQTR